MNNQPKNTALPKLRFPEFRGVGKWETELFKDLYSFKGTNSFSRDKLTHEGGAVRNIHYGDIHTKFSTLFDITKEKVPFINSSVAIDKIKEENYCVEGDIIFADASEDLNDIGKSIEIVNLNSEKVLSGLHTQFARQKENKLVIGFAGYLFTSGAIRSQIQNESQGTKVLGISAGRLSKIEVCYPSDKREQQKIAATLSSLDDLLTAQTAQLTALQAHKRGLMQALFPAEGETVPKLRFPEFQGVGEWEEKTLGDLLEFRNGINASKELYGKGFKFINVMDILNNEFITHDLIIGSVNVSPEIFEKFSVNYGDILFQRSSETQEEVGTANVYLDKEKAATFGGFVIRGKKVGEYEPVFLNKLLKTQYVRNSISSKAGGSTRYNVGQEVLASVKLLLPSPTEQQKIADCLSSLDARITAQAQQLDALKLHKKGLMQALFPAAAEPTA